MREEIVARRVAESLSGEMRDEGLSTAREWVPPCPHIPGATVSHKTDNGLRVVLDCTLIARRCRRGFMSAAPGGWGFLVQSPSQIISIWCSITSLIFVLIGTEWVFCGRIYLRVRDHQGGELGACCVYSPDRYWEDTERCQKGFERAFGGNAFYGPTNFSVCGGSPFCLDTMRRSWWANFVMVLGTYSRCNHRATGRLGSMPSRWGGMCRECLVSDGYLVVPPPEMDVFMDLGHLEKVRKAERKFVAILLT